MYNIIFTLFIVHLCAQILKHTLLHSICHADQAKILYTKPCVNSFITLHNDPEVYSSDI